MSIIYPPNSLGNLEYLEFIAHIQILISLCQSPLDRWCKFVASTTHTVCIQSPLFRLMRWLRPWGISASPVVSASHSGERRCASTVDGITLIWVGIK